jgi:hypothetical protein
MKSLIRREWVVPVAAAVLAVLIPLRWLGGGDLTQPPAPDYHVTRLQVVAPAAFDQAFSRPAFSPTRLAAGTPDPSTVLAAPATSAPDAAPQVPLPDLPKLVGLAISGRGSGVALVRQADGKTLTLNRGQSVDGWLLVSLGRDWAGFVQRGARRTVRLDFPNSVGRSTAQANNLAIPLPPPGTGPLPSSFTALPEAQLPQGSDR